MNSAPKKQFGLWTLTFLVVANMIGAAVFTGAGWNMMALHSPTLVVFAWIVAGLIAICGAISYGQLIQNVPESGGEYLFLSRAYHPMLGFVAGWVSMFAGFSSAIAYAAMTFEAYAFPDDTLASLNLPKGSAAITIVVLAALIHGIKVKVGAQAQNVAVILKLVLLFLFLLFAFFKLSPGTVANEMEPVTGMTLFEAFCTQLMFIALSYMGFNAAVYIADEVEDAKTVIPKALLLGTVIVMVLYVSLNYVFVHSADASVVAESGDTVAAMSAQHLGGTAFRILFTIIICSALFTSVTSMMMAAPRVYAKMADEGMLPKFFKFQNETPIYSIVLQTILASVVICYSTLYQLLGYLGITLSLCAAASVSSLFLPKFRQNKSLFSLSLIAPFLYVFCTVVAIYFAVQYRRDLGGQKSVYAAFLTFGVGAVLYMIKAALTRSTDSKEQKKQS